jgi:hypothetical protein
MKRKIFICITVGASVIALGACGSSTPRVNLSECTIAHAPALAAQYGSNLPPACKQKITDEVNQLNTHLQYWDTCSRVPLDQYSQCMTNLGESPNGVRVGAAPESP